MRVLILGCGPAGLMAAHGAVKGGADSVQIISKKRKSELFGAQYLHAPIPEMPMGNHVRINYILEGDAQAYREKVYGRNWDGTVSPEDLTEPHSAWDIRAAYDWLWDQYGKYVVDMELSRAHTVSTDSADVVISTIPRPVLCTQEHVFKSADVWAAGDAPSRGIAIPYVCEENTVICNGHRSPLWYRLSNVFGHKTIEWPMYGDLKPPVENVSLVHKPTSHNCDCNPGIVYAGRYGRWEKGILSHTAYTTALNALEDRAWHAT